MSKAKITLIGLENYCRGAGESLFTGWNVPSGIDQDIMKNTILMRAQEFELLYSDPVFLKSAINLWSSKWYRTFEKWVNALSIEYDPLYNYDRTEEIKERIDEDTKSSNSGSSTSRNEITSSGKTESDSTDTSSVSAYNTSSFDNSDKNVHDGETKTSDSSRSNGSGTSKNDGTENKDIVRDHKARMYGNIGVTTTQQMLESELDIATWNLYEHIADIFIKEFCIMVY